MTRSAPGVADRARAALPGRRGTGGGGHGKREPRAAAGCRTARGAGGAARPRGRDAGRDSAAAARAGGGRAGDAMRRARGGGCRPHPPARNARGCRRPLANSGADDPARRPAASPNPARHGTGRSIRARPRSGGAAEAARRRRVPAGGFRGAA